MTAVVPRTTAGPSPRPRFRRRSVRVLGTAVLWLSGVLLVVAVALPHLGLRLLTVQSGSMAPAVPAGSIVLARHAPVAELTTGQVITFYPPTERPVLTTHRVVALERSDGATIVTTRGDANPGADPWRAELLDERCWVVVAALPWVGRVADVLGSPAGITVGAFLLPAAFLVSTLHLIWCPRPGAGLRGARRATVVLAAGLVWSVVLAAAAEARAGFTASVARTHTVATAVLSAPTGLRVQDVCLLALAAVDVSWTPTGSGPTGHRIERRDAGTTAWTTLATVTGISGYRDATTARLTGYDYRVSPVLGSWTGAASTGSVTTAGAC